MDGVDDNSSSADNTSSDEDDENSGGSGKKRKRAAFTEADRKMLESMGDEDGDEGDEAAGGKVRVWIISVLSSVVDVSSHGFGHRYREDEACERFFFVLSIRGRGGAIEVEPPVER